MLIFILYFSRADKNFSKEVFVDFMSAQIRTLSFLAYITRIYQDVVMKNHKMMVEGMLNMLRLCPKEVTGLRRDLFIASRHILSTELRLSMFIFSVFSSFLMVDSVVQCHLR